MSLISIECISDALTELGLDSDKFIIPSCESGLVSVSSNNNTTITGKAFTVVMCDIDDPRPSIFKNTRDYLDIVPDDSVIIILCDSHNKKYSTWGELLCDYALKHNIKCTITTGCIRDVNQIVNHEYPVFAQKGLYTPIRGNGKYKVVDVQVPIKLHNIIIHPNDNVFVSNSGIAIVPDCNIHKLYEIIYNIIAKEMHIKELIDKGLTLKMIDNIIMSKDIYKNLNV